MNVVVVRHMITKNMGHFFQGGITNRKNCEDHKNFGHLFFRGELRTERIVKMFLGKVSFSQGGNYLGAKVKGGKSRVIIRRAGPSSLPNLRHCDLCAQMQHRRANLRIRRDSFQIVWKEFAISEVCFLFVCSYCGALCILQDIRCWPKVLAKRK